MPSFIRTWRRGAELAVQMLLDHHRKAPRTRLPVEIFVRENIID